MMHRHTYPAHRAGYYCTRDTCEEINLPRFPVLLFRAICPYCLRDVIGPPSGMLMTSEEQGGQQVERILASHNCPRDAAPREGRADG